ncbi:MAG: gamma-glutamylcyclotransferase [Pelosinus sp.]|nr:gamma-glutamylcyclotransferase [Pelosinus sp.]
MTDIRLYFAYGLNLNLTEMKKKCPHAKALGIAKLPGHQLNFYGHSTVWDGATESVTLQPSEEVWGVIYKLSAADWDILDGFEDARFDGTGAYFHFPVEVIDRSGALLPATIYKKAVLREPLPPSSEYLALICQGAKVQGLPENYIAFLKSMSSKPATYKVPQQPKGRHLLMGGDCSECC